MTTRRGKGELGGHMPGKNWSLCPYRKTWSLLFSGTDVVKLLLWVRHCSLPLSQQLRCLILYMQEESDHQVK